jgi:hypothetical protein
MEAQATSRGKVSGTDLILVVTQALAHGQLKRALVNSSRLIVAVVAGGLPSLIVSRCVAGFFPL